MNTQKQITIKLVDSLQKALDCPVIKSHSHTKTPPYPYVSFTVTNPLVANGGTWGEYEDGKQRKPFNQVWSFTVQSDDDSVALNLVMRLYEFLDRRNEGLADEGIIVESVTNISNRDSFVTIQYEYRYGFDVTFLFMRENTDVIPAPELVDAVAEYETRGG